VKYWQWQFSGPTCPQVMSRRRDLRVETPKSLTLALAGSLRASVKDISRRGLCLSADVPLALGSIHSLTLTLGCMTVSRRGRTIHCHRHPTDGWIIGIEFLDDAARPGDNAIEDLVLEVAAGDVLFR
jgi:PilZ domain